MPAVNIGGSNKRLRRRVAGMIVLDDFEAVIFDMDGLLIDTERIFRGAVVETVAAMGYDLPPAVQRDMVGLADTDTILQTFFGPRFSPAKFRRRLREAVDSRLEAGVPLRPGAVELVDFLEQQGVRKAVATSSRRPTAEKHLGRCGLRHRFEVIVTRDDVERGKPHPDVYLLAAAALGLSPQRCIALEDSFNGVRAANGAGVPVIMVPDLLQPTTEIAALCATVMDDLHQIRKLFSERSVTA